jgi:hypothetical protein
MLTYKLTGTTEDFGDDLDEPNHNPPSHPARQTSSGTESSRTKVRPKRRRTADLDLSPRGPDDAIEMTLRTGSR